MAYSPAKAWFYLNKRPARKFAPPNSPPKGFAYVKDGNGRYVQDANGNYVLEPAS